MYVFRFLGVLLFVVCAFCSIGNSAVVVRADNITIPVGFAEATMDVWIAAESSDVQLNRADFRFRIDPVGDTQTRLSFRGTQDDLQLGDAAYVFAGGSLKRDGFLFFAPSPVGMVSSFDSPGDTFDGGDVSTFPTLFGNVGLTSTPLLLSRLQIIPGPGTLSPTAGDKFAISLIEGSGTSFGEIGFAFEGGAVTVVPEISGRGVWFLIIGFAIIKMSGVGAIVRTNSGDSLGRG